MDSNPEVKLGKYKHYKGKIMEVIGLGKHSETLQDFVVYKHVNDMDESEEFKGVLWIRPLSMFLEEIEVDGKMIKRFTYLGK